MVTCAQVGTVKRNPHFNFHTSHISPLPNSPTVALSYPNWCAPIYDEYNALVKNSTWMLVLKPPNANMVGIDCDDTFSLVVKPATIQTFLNLALSCGWPVHQLDVKNAFLNDDVLETVYMYQPLIGFSASRFDSSLFIYRHGTEVASLLIYVDDIVLTTSSMALLQHITSSLNQEFEMAALGALDCFLRIYVNRDSIESKLGPDRDPVLDPTLYQILAGGLQNYVPLGIGLVGDIKSEKRILDTSELDGIPADRTSAQKLKVRFKVSAIVKLMVIKEV
ncbi:ribonuclease H-like domain-containing protein [Tanacetum coccineum]